MAHEFGFDRNIRGELDPDANQSIAELFRSADADGSGALDSFEGVRLLTLCESRSFAADQRDGASRKLKIVAGLTLAVLLLASEAFHQLERGWTRLDGLYYGVVTLTTVGLGDYVPGSERARFAWYLFITCGLGLVASLLGSLARFVAQYCAAAEKDDARCLVRRPLVKAGWLLRWGSRLAVGWRVEAEEASGATPLSCTWAVL